MNPAPCWLCMPHHPVPGSGLARRGCAGGAIALAACGAACAQTAEQMPAVAAEMTAAALNAPEAARWALVPEVNAERIRLVSPGAAPLAPDGTPVNHLAAVNVRWWLLRGPAGVGLGVGTLDLRPSSAEAQGPSSAMAQPIAIPVHLAPTVSVGMQLRMTGQSALYADASGAMGLPPDGTLGYVRTKVGLEWKPAKARFGLDEGRVGVQFDSGYRLSFRLRRGGLGVYLRGQF